MLANTACAPGSVGASAAGIASKISKSPTEEEAAASAEGIAPKILNCSPNQDKPEKGSNLKTMFSDRKMSRDSSNAGAGEGQLAYAQKDPSLSLSIGTQCVHACFVGLRSRSCVLFMFHHSM